MIGIVIINYVNYKVTLECVNSILLNPPSESFKIYLIDNGSNNESADIFKEQYSDNPLIHLSLLPNNMGFARACNHGIHLCRKEQVKECVLTNSDVSFPAHTLDLLINDIRSLDNAIIVGPKVYNPLDRCFQHSSRLLAPSVLEPFELHRLIRVFRKPKELDEENSNGVRRVYLVSGCCFVLDVEKFQDIHDFDENTFLYNEENILGFKAREKGYNTYIDLGVVIEHRHGSSSGRRNDYTSTELLKSNLYYWKKYRNFGDALLALHIVIYCVKMKLVSISGKELHPWAIFKRGIAYLRTL